ncbi:hypothetical protein [Paenibacillus durus]|uniref:Lipoprotein n=1 Tax=Paenibacillus durus TaxID=44251 RepID=A0A089HQK6_PAEDU|nr:hypothetical protein [Paenibacillus durus]AIQ14296.1 hypothetical protein PDUR_22110 [Paenibacillus durus]
MNHIKYLILIILVCAFIGGCKSNTITEAFRKQHPDQHYELLYTKQVEEKVIGFYKAPFDSNNTGIGVAIFQGNEQKGWKVIDSYSYYSPSKVIIEAGRIHLDQKESYRILYGLIDTPDITKIEVTDKHGQIIEGNIINTNWKRIWYAIAEINEMKVKAYTKDGKVAVEVPYKDKE